MTNTRPRSRDIRKSVTVCETEPQPDPSSGKEHLLMTTPRKYVKNNFVSTAYKIFIKDKSTHTLGSVQKSIAIIVVKDVCHGISCN